MTGMTKALTGMTKALALARVTAREILGQPLTRIVLGATVLLLFVATFLPSFTLEDEGDLKFMCDVGLASLAMALMVIGLWPAATLLADELSQRTAMTLLAKPLSRRDYLVGRYMGILGALSVCAVLLVAVFLFAAWLTEGQVISSRLDRFFAEATYGPSASPESEPAIPLPPVRWYLGGAVLLGLGQAAVLCALAVAFSARMGALPNLACCVAVFLAGHLEAALAGGIPWLTWAARAVLPDFELFDLSEAVARGAAIPPAYVAACLAYAVCYAAAALAVAVPLFERRELT